MKCLGDFTAPVRPEELDDCVEIPSQMNGLATVTDFMKNNAVAIVAVSILAIGLMAMKERN